MSPDPILPGVYIQEFPPGKRTITGASTSVAAFVDRFSRGPMETPVRISSMSEFERDFGGLERTSAASYGIRQFFLNGGSEAWVIRVETSNSAAADVVLEGGGLEIVRIHAGRRVDRTSREDHGDWGNGLRVEVNYETSDPASEFNLLVSAVADEGGRTVVRRSETFRNLTMRPGASNNAVEVVNANSRIVQLSRDGLTDPLPDPWIDSFRPDATGTLGTERPAPASGPIVDDGAQLRITVSPGGDEADLDPLVATVSFDGADPPADYTTLRPFLERAIRSSDSENPLLAGARVIFAGERFRVLLGRGGHGFQAGAAIRFANEGADTTAEDLGLTGTGVRVGPQLIRLDHGENGDAPSEGDLRGEPSAKTGIHALEDADHFNILCIPAAAELRAASMRAVYGEAIAYCEKRRAFLLVDISEAEGSLDRMEAWLTENAGLRHPNAAVYFPRIRIADPLDRNRLRSLGPSGTLAGLFARTDDSRGVWKAPAGTEARLRNVEALDYELTHRENGVLNPLGANALRLLPVVGPVAWGARTLDGADVQASEWKYIPVRRMALFLEESIIRGTQWVVSEPNDEDLWGEIRLNVGTFMHNLFRQGAFQGETPQRAYLVKCDRETTTQADIDGGTVNVLVGFAALKPAEFVIIRIRQRAGQGEVQA